MRSVSISVTEASRNFADCINRARYQGTTFLLHKNGVAVARIVPEQKAQAEVPAERVPDEEAAPAHPEPVRVQCSDGGSVRPQRMIW
jgi:antitoxin (DNA-binding transcriptional repressor) of toxin-antitoxin stability system